MIRDEIHNHLQIAASHLLAAMKPGCNNTIHTMSAPDMVDTYNVYISWYEGKTKYSVMRTYNARVDESPEDWTNRALREEIAGRGEQQA